MAKLERKFFREWELSEKAYQSYIDISFIFYLDADGIYYFAECPKSKIERIGDIKQLESFLIAYSE